MKTAYFEARELDLPGILLITPVRYEDVRGFSMNAYDCEQFAALGITARFVQDFVSQSAKDVIRGFHYQRAPHAQDKLVRVSAGAIFDVAIDYDSASPTHGKCASARLDAEAGTMLYIPGRYAHGYCVLSDSATLEYKLSDTYHAESAGGVRYDDPIFAIAWPISDPILSDKDKAWPMLSVPTT